MKKKQNLKSSSNKSVLKIHESTKKIGPVIFASPHSGRNYDDTFISQTRLEYSILRQSEDAFVEEIFMDAPIFGAPLLTALFPRAFVDANRHSWELDQNMFKDKLPSYVTTKSPYISAGLGTIPRLVGNGKEIYDNKLLFSEIRQRIVKNYIPYHKALQALIKKTIAIHQSCLLIDCHSMPSANKSFERSKTNLPDIVLGDNHGKACSQRIVELIERNLLSQGLSVIRNKPYAGGFTTQNYSNKEEGIHVIQIEINRSLYMDEKRIKRLPSLKVLIEKIKVLIEELTAIDPNTLKRSKFISLKAAE